MRRFARNSRGRITALALAIGLALLPARLPRAAESSTRLEEVPIEASERDHWAYRPLADAEPPVVEDAAWSHHPIDAFVKARLEANQIEPLPTVGKATLLRRVCFDLTGLPPTPDEIEAFLADDAPDAYARLVDRLLASPAYGERYAQHWLDLARFAETDGFEHDLLRPNAWRYRDWVIDALNRDMPYDAFVRQQLAGDQLHPGDPDAAIATGFLLCGPDMPDINLQQERRHVVLNEMAATVGSVFLAMQFGCAQCHDHKYDPIRIQDFYRLRAFFESSDIFRDHPIPSSDDLARLQEAEAAHEAKYGEAEARRKKLESIAKDRFSEKHPGARYSLKKALAELSDDQRREHQQLVKLLDEAPELPKPPRGRVMRAGQQREARVYLRGDFRSPGPIVSSSYPRVLDPDDSMTDADRQQPRVALAEWLSSGENPLVARVIVNRVWQWHFGVGLVPTSSDFGTMGRETMHPQLLDWLAQRFVADGWSLKKLHRLIVTSRTYRLAAVPYDAAWSDGEREHARAVWERSGQSDPEAALLWRRGRQRLEGEAIRDAMLTACEKLSDRTQGPGIRPPLAPEVTKTLLKNQWNVSGDEEDHRRRSIYLFVRRNLRYPMFDVFDRPDTNASCPMRHESTTATQSLTQFNSEFSLRCARWLAGIVGDEPEPADAVARAYLRVFNRPASDEEIAAGVKFIGEQADRLRAESRDADTLALPLPGEQSHADEPHAAAALVDFCLALFNASEFLYVE